MCSAEDSKASCSILGLWDWQGASREAGPRRSLLTWADFDSGLSQTHSDTLDWVCAAFVPEHSLS